MDINATLIGQMITFAVFVVFTMKFVWPPITKVMQAGEKKIADGLAAAERGEHSLELARGKAKEIIDYFLGFSPGKLKAVLPPFGCSQTIGDFFLPGLHYLGNRRPNEFHGEHNEHRECNHLTY